MKPEIVNAKISETFLGKEDHGIFTYMIYLDYGNSGIQGFGSYGLDDWNEEKKERVGIGYGVETLKRILEALEVESWEKLPGTVCRVEKTHSKVYRIGHFMKEQWFSPKDLWNELHPDEPIED